MGRAMAHERWFAHAMALAFSSSACGMSEHLPSPPKRQPWYEHISVPSDGSMRPSAHMHCKHQPDYFLTQMTCQVLVSVEFCQFKLGACDCCYSNPI